MITCGRCGEEVRYGTRGSTTGWLHRTDVGHQAILGRPASPEDLAEIERQLDLPRERTRADGTVEAYTTRQNDLERYRKNKKFREAEERETQDDIEVEPLPPPEVPCEPIGVDSFAPRSGIRQVINLVAKQGWELRRLTRARGPYVGADGSLLSISDTVVLGARGPSGFDGTTRVAVASWRDGKFDFAFTGTLKDGRLSTTKADATTMKNWIKGIA